MNHLIIMWSVLLCISNSWAQTNIKTISGNTMGTTYSIQLQIEDSNIMQTDIKESIEQELERVNNALSVFRVNSEISNLNINGTGDAIQVSKYIWDVLKIAKDTSRQTDGALDVTLSPVIEFWGFGVKSRDLQSKNRGQLELARSKTGMAGFSLNKNSKTLTKLNRDVEINPSSVAKGYGVDCIAQLLNQLGIQHYLVEIGGEVRSRGVRADGHDWQVAVTRPEKFSLKIQKLVKLKDMSMATSGSYVNFIESGDRKLSHIIDPSSGQPIQNSVISVSVLHPLCAVADGFATAMMILNVERSIQIANELSLPVMIIEQTDAGLQTHYSDSILQYITK